MFNKDFVVLSGKNSRNTRLVDFLSELGLMNRYFTSTKEIEDSNVLQMHIDYSNVNRTIVEMRKTSLDILKSIVNE